MTRRALGAACAGHAPAARRGHRRPAPIEDNCTQQSRRVRVPGGFAEARVSFVGVLTNGRNRAGESFPGDGLRELRLVVDWTEVEKVHHQRVELSSPDGELYQRFATHVHRHRAAGVGHRRGCR